MHPLPTGEKKPANVSVCRTVKAIGMPRIKSFLINVIAGTVNSNLYLKMPMAKPKFIHPIIGRIF